MLRFNHPDCTYSGRGQPIGKGCPKHAGPVHDLYGVEVGQHDKVDVMNVTSQPTKVKGRGHSKRHTEAGPGHLQAWEYAGNIPGMLQVEWGRSDRQIYKGCYQEEELEGATAEECPCAGDTASQMLDAWPGL